MTKIKLGVIGGGVNSAVGYAHYAAANMDGLFGFETGCFSRNAHTNQESAFAYHIQKNNLYNSIAELIENSEKIDCWLVLLPTPDHFDILQKLSKTGKPVICEKALCSTPEETETIISTFSPERLFVIFNYTGYPMVREMRALIANGITGDIITINSIMPQSGFIKRDKHGSFASPQEWRLKDGSISTISLDLGVHIHCLIAFVSGLEVEQIHAFSNNAGLSSAIRDNVTCSMRLNNNAIGNIWYSKTALGNTNGLGIEIYGTKGSLYWKQLNPDELKVADEFNVTRIMDRSNNELLEAGKTKYNRFKAGHPTGFVEALANYYRSIHDSLMGREDGYLFKPEHILKGMQLMGAIEKSIHKNQTL